MKLNIQLVIDDNVVRAALKERGVDVNKANIARLGKLISGNHLRADAEFLQTLTEDRSELLMHGFTFRKEAERIG
ncbi:hypothetical protein [Cohnella nanjingensis]|nr:hypothetical protein [Cohnella nanjingensis]